MIRGDRLLEEDRQYITTEIAKATPKQREEMRLELLILSARFRDDPYGFSDFYQVIHGERMPWHAYYEWIIPTYWVDGVLSDDDIDLLYSKAPEYKEMVEDIRLQLKDMGDLSSGIVIEAFRGSTKTTTVTGTYCTFRIGHEPHKSNLLIQAGDKSATKNAKKIADTIKNNPGWMRVFPHIVPDPDLGWSADGYEVKVTQDIKTGEVLDYPAWREMNSKRVDPTLLGVGYESSQIIGKHPDGLLVIDDIHDEKNTSSSREQETVRVILTDTIFPTMTKQTRKVFIGTPWNENDTLHYVASTGEFLHVKTPVKRGDKLTWPEKFDQEEVAKWERISGKRGFARMYMLDLSYSKNRVFKYQLYPSSEIRSNLPMAGGVDFAGTMDEYTNKAGKNDYFAMAYTAKLPGYGAVVVDGVLEHCTQAQGETYVKIPQAIFSNWLHTVVEGDGTGEGFVQVLRRNPGLRIIPMKTKGRGKGRRLEGEMGPWLESGTLRISDAETPFLNELRHELDTYPDCENDDALDALYWSTRGMPDVFVLRDNDDQLPVPGANKKEQQVHPYCSLGRK